MNLARWAGLCGSNDRADDCANDPNDKTKCANALKKVPKHIADVGLNDKPSHRDQIPNDRHDEEHQEPSHRWLCTSNIRADDSANVCSENKKKPANGIKLTPPRIQEFGKPRHRQGKADNPQDQKQERSHRWMASCASPLVCTACAEWNPCLLHRCCRCLGGRAVGHSVQRVPSKWRSRAAVVESGYHPAGASAITAPLV